MGSPLSPIIADFVLQDLETSALLQIPTHIPIYYRYVDDILIAAPKNFLNDILQTYNSFHQRLQFTLDYTDNNSINFLDISIFINDRQIISNWYHKLTFSGRYINYYSHLLMCYKRGTIIGLVDRVFRLSHPQYHNTNFTFVIDLLLDNSYPLDFIFKTISRRLRCLINGTSAPSLTTEISFFPIPFVKNFSDRFMKLFDNKTYKLAYFGINNLQWCIKPLKDSLPVLSKNSVVYKLQCSQCEASYVGQTSRRLISRIKEHRRVPIDPDSYTVVTEHRINNEHEFDWDNVLVLDRESSYKKRSISEMIHIKKQVHAINAHTDTALLNSAYLPLIKKT